MKPIVLILMLLTFGWPLGAEEKPDVFRAENLDAWCIVPFDAKKRGPDERAQMLKRLGISRLAYDYRAEHVPTFDAEVEAMKREGIEFTAWWFPGGLNDEARLILEVIARHRITPQLWITGGGEAPKDGVAAAALVEAEAGRIRPIAEAAAPLGCQVALYNHGGWFGEPENQVAIIERLARDGVKNVGIVYNFHHGHPHLARFADLWKKMMPHLLAVNLNGMEVDGDQRGRKILHLGEGDQELGMMRIIRESGWQGPVGIIDHREETDSEETLKKNLRGLKWLRQELAQPGSGGPPPFPPKSAAVSDQGRFGKALDAREGGVVHPGKPAYRTRPLTIEAWARLESAAGFNILVAHDPKASAAHWELYTFTGTGHFHVYLPGHGGDYGSGVSLCDDRWHHVAAVMEENRLRMYVDGVLAKDAVLPARQGGEQPGGLAIGQLVEGGVGCRGLVDEVRIRAGLHPPGGLPTEMPAADDSVLGSWSFETPADAGRRRSSFRPPRPPLRPDQHSLLAHPINRDRIYDFYAKQLVHAQTQIPPRGRLDPFPGLDGGTFGHWGNQSEESWRSDARNAMDVGTVQAEIFQGWGLTVPRAVCVRLGEQGEMGACFDPDSLRWVAAWTGGFVSFGTGRFGFLEGCRPVGERVALRDEQTGSAAAAVGTFEYHGFYRIGPRVVFHYTRDGRDWLDSAWCEAGCFVRRVEPADPERLRRLAGGAAAQWPQVLVTAGVLGTGAPYAVDTIGLPEATPWRSLFHFGDHDFFPNGDAAVCTFEGEVWLVRGLRDGLEKVTWKRFAAGLHQALGLKIAEGKIHVRGRDQITRLHDGNGDDEADYYECFSNAAATSVGGHDYTTGLQRDAAGRFYFASSHEGVCRVSADGRTQEVLATGFRNPNGLGLSPEGEIMVAVQEGDWTPASMLAEVIPGGHYGRGGPRPGPLGHVPPLVYLPRGLDPSCGGQVFVEGDRWGVPAGSLVHLSFGAAAAFLVVRDAVHRDQGVVVPWPGDFASGAHRGRFHPVDGQLWVTGMTGWITYGPEAGCLQRLRYTGGQVQAPRQVEARDNGLLLTFAEPVGSAAAAPAGWLAQSWNYRYSEAYGSEEWSAREPGQPGHDWLEVTGVHRLGDGRTIFVEIPQLQPTHTLHLHAPDLAAGPVDFYFTLHRLGPALTEFPGYREVAKVPLPVEDTAAVAASRPQAVKWEQGPAGREVRIQAAAGLQFAQRELEVTAGERISLVFDNPDVIPHNWVLGSRGSMSRLFTLSNQFLTDPRAFAMHYVPPAPEVLVHTRMLEPATSTTIHFNAPAEAGEYPYLCTFPGHGAIMRGLLLVR